MATLEKVRLDLIDFNPHRRIEVYPLNRRKIAAGAIL